MTTWAWIIIIAVVALAAGGIVARAAHGRRSEALRERFGPEYDRTVALSGGQRAAEQDLLGRQRRHDELDVHPLPEEARQRYLERWREIEAGFGDDPPAAIEEADGLLRRAMDERGYADGDLEQRIGDLSVDHPEAVEQFRSAHDVAIRARVGDASTDDLQKALAGYRGLFEQLVGGSAPTR